MNEIQKNNAMKQSINIFKNRKRKMIRYCYMPICATTLLLALTSFCSLGQKSDLNIEKIIKKLLPNLRYIPAKSFTSLAYKGSDSVASYGPRITSVPAFYISQTEVTNKEYREFVHYVRDSVAHRLLRHFGSDNRLDWDQDINWNDSRLDAMMTAPDERIFGKKEIDPAKLNFIVDFFGKKEMINIYPDTLVWIRDFSYSYNEPLVKKYFSHPSYNDYPVLGISLKQAMAFCEWKTGQLHSRLVVRLPSNAEWESAAIGEKDKAADPAMTKPYRCNFGSMPGPSGTTIKGNKDDGYFYTGPVKSYPAEDYGLYDMKGNVAEWTSTALDEIMHVEVKPEKQKRLFIVKGGGWNSSLFYLQPGVCQFYHADAVNTWTGFRYVVSAPAKNK